MSKSKPKFNKTNSNVDWARWTWNPVTGCFHGCKYCYARDIGNRFNKNFTPTFHPERLEAPKNTRVPNVIGIGERSVFVCSMADLFGDWVPQTWIDKVLDAVRESPQWNFIFLTKNPKRLVDIDFPENAWVGTTVDIQERITPAEEAFRQINATVKFLSCEPLREELTFANLRYFDWVIIGGQSRSTGEKARQPEPEWVENLIAQARGAGCKVYCKPNLQTLGLSEKPKEYPLNNGIFRLRMP